MHTFVEMASTLICTFLVCSALVLVVAAVSQVLQGQEDSRQEAATKSTDSAMDPPAHWQHHSVSGTTVRAATGVG